jgi:hypothetical protein
MCTYACVCACTCVCVRQNGPVYVYTYTHTHTQVMLRQLAMGGGPKQVQARLEKELKEEFGDLPREELRKVIRERMQKMNERDATMMLEKSGEQVL